MKRNISIDMALTPREIEEEVWNMDSENQIELLKYFVWRYESTKHFPVLMQMQNIHDDLKVFCDEDERRSIINLVSTFLDYISDDGVKKESADNEGAEALEECKTGKWIEKDGWDGDVYYDCSVCGESWTTIEGTPWDNDMNYCPHCGAKMEGAEE